MLDLADAIHENELLADELVLVELVLALVFDDLVLHARKERGQLVIIVLRQLVERMIVALGALHANAEEDLGKRFGANLRVAQGPIIIGRRLLVRAAAAGDKRAGEFVERCIIGNVLANPAVEDLDAGFVELLLLDAQEVGPLERPGVGELGPIQKRVDQPGALAGPRVGEELARLLGRRQQSGQI